MSERSGQQTRIEQLDVLRGLAAIAVIIFHFTTRYVELFGGPLPAFSLSAGQYGVHLFFIISGFVIFMTIERSRSRRDFLVSRFARLYPVFWAAMTITVAADMLDPSLGIHHTPVQILANLTMFEEYIRILPIDGSYWSLSYELGFYLFMVAMFGTPLLRYPWLLCLFWVAAALLYLARHDLIPSGVHYLLVAHKYGHLFAAGLALYWLHTRGLQSFIGSALLLFVLCVAAPVQYLYDGLEGGLAVAFCLLLVIAALRGWLRFITNRLTLWLGAISYPLYLVHQQVGWHIIKAVRDHGLMGATASVLLAMLVVIGIGGLLSRYIEYPARGWIVSRYKAFRSQQKAPTV
jgi:peptidoglycan/LPS O-acetylase OafA/YrhL